MLGEMTGNLSFRDEKAAVGDTLVSSKKKKSMEEVVYLIGSRGRNKLELKLHLGGGGKKEKSFCCRTE